MLPKLLGLIKDEVEFVYGTGTQTIEIPSKYYRHLEPNSIEIA